MGVDILHIRQDSQASRYISTMHSSDPAQPLCSFDFSSITSKLGYWITVMDAWVLLAWIHNDSFAVSVALEWDNSIHHFDFIEINDKLYIEVNEHQIQFIKDSEIISF